MKRKYLTIKDIQINENEIKKALNLSISSQSSLFDNMKTIPTFEKYKSLIDAKYKSKKDKNPRAEIQKDLRDLKKHLSGAVIIKSFEGYKRPSLEGLRSDIESYLKRTKLKSLAQPRQQIGKDFEISFAKLIDNAIDDDDTSIKPLAIDGKSISKIIESGEYSDFHVKNVKFNYNNKHDIKLSSKEIKYKSGRVLKTLDTVPMNYLELKHDGKLNSKNGISGLMLFESGKISTYPKLFKIMDLLDEDKTIYTPGNKTLIGKSGLKGKDKEDRETLKNALNDRFEAMKKTIVFEQAKVESFLTKIANNLEVKEAVKASMQKSPNNYVVVGKNTLNDKGTEFEIDPIIKKLSDMKLNVEFKAGWKGFGRVIGSLSSLNESDGDGVVFQIELKNKKSNVVAGQFGTKKKLKLAASVEKELGDFLSEITDV